MATTFKATNNQPKAGLISILDLPVLGDSTVNTNNEIVITGFDTPIPFDDVRQMVVTTFAAGQARIVTIDIGTLTLVSTGKAFVLQLFQNGVKVEPSFVVNTSGTDAAATDAIGANYETQITLKDAATGAAFPITASYASGSNLLTLTQKSDTDTLIAGTVTYTITDDATQAETQAFIRPEGTLAQAQAFDGTATSTQNSVYEITFDDFDQSNKASGAVVGSRTKAIVFANDQAAGFADFDAAIKRTFANTPLNKLIQDGAATRAITGGGGAPLITATTLTRLDDYIIVDTTAGDVDITLPLLADAGKKVFHIINIAAANSIIIKDIAGYTVNGADSDKTITAGKSCQVIGDEADTNWITEEYA